MPDIDVDFVAGASGDRLRRQKYGRHNVAQIITFGTMQAKAAIRDVGRVMGMPYGDVDRIAKFVPELPKITLEGRRIKRRRAAQLRRPG